jgi:Uma2 family endonuclease
MSQIIDQPEILPAHLYNDIPVNVLGEPAPLDSDGKISFDAFIVWAEGSNAEWVDGVIEMNNTTTLSHNDVIGFLEAVIRQYVEVYDLGKVYSENYLMKILTQKADNKKGAGRAPDIIYVKKENKHRFTRMFLEGPADFAVEVISPESVTRDRKKKFAEYAAAGVSEYWIIDPDKKKADFFVLEDNNYKRVKPGANGRYDSHAISGFWIKVDWFWENTMPKIEDALMQIGGESYRQRQALRLVKTGDNNYRTFLTNHLIETGDEAYIQNLLDELRKKGHLPPEKE